MSANQGAVELVARYLCRDYWGSEERWEEYLDQSRVLIDLVVTADKEARK